MQTCATRTMLGLVLAVGAASSAIAQVGPRVGQYPDVIVSSTGGSYDTTGNGAIGNYGSANGWSAYAIGSDSCNIGTHAAIWIDAGTFSNQHPVIGQEIYRLFNGRFEQIGMSWLKHGFCAADSCSTGNNSGGTQGCLNIGGQPPGSSGCTNDLGSPSGGCDWLGYGRSTDTYGSGLNGGQTYLGPRSEVNAWSGVYPYPYVRQGSNPSSCLNKRLLVRTSDLDPANYPRYNASTNPTGAQFWGEVVYIVTDEWPTERYNNYSYRKITAGTTLTSPSGGCGGTLYNLDFTGSGAGLTVPFKPAIYAWQVADPSVVIRTVDAPNDGRFVIGAKTTDLGNGTWLYEYAVFNLNSHRSAGTFEIPKASAAVQVSWTGFHAPEYHSGEPFVAKNWDVTNSANSLVFATDPYTVNANANAIRWSTLYNFRLIANQPPKSEPNARIRIGLFKPGVQTTDANFVEVGNIPVPGDPPTCVADFDNNGSVQSDDIFAFLNAWFAADLRTDVNNSGALEVTDIFGFLNTWFNGCP